MRPPYLPQMRLFQDWLREHRGLSFDNYDALWQWSVNDQPAFWQSIWDYEGMHSPTRYEAVLADARMPGARWFPGAKVNYAQRVLRHVDAAQAAGVQAIISENELGQPLTKVVKPDAMANAHCLPGDVAPCKKEPARQGACGLVKPLRGRASDQAIQSLSSSTSCT